MIWRSYDDNFHMAHIFLGIKSLYFPSKVQQDEIQSNALFTNIGPDQSKNINYTGDKTYKTYLKEPKLGISDI